MYDGRLMDESVRAFVESCDLVLTVGTVMTDFNTGAFTVPARSGEDDQHPPSQRGNWIKGLSECCIEGCPG